MKLIHVFALLARGKGMFAPRPAVCRPSRITVPDPRGLGADAGAHARLAEFRGNLPLHGESAEPPSLRT